MKNIKAKFKMAGLVASLSLLITLTSCSNGFFKSTNVMIDDVYSTINEEGDVEITITFVDDAKEPLTFIVPQGQVGNGIASITQTPNPDGSKTLVTITYTDLNMAPLQFEVTNGVSIVSITSEVSELDDSIIVVKITLSNGEILSFNINKPKDGVDGNAITGVTQVVNEDNSITLTIHFSNTEDVVVTIPGGSEGKAGDSVEAITMMQKGDYYEYTFLMTSGKSHVISVARPATWISGSGAPQPYIGLVGDYYYDRTFNVIYFKAPTGWQIQLDFNDTLEDVFYTVTFDFNAASPYPSWEDNDVFPDGQTPVYQIAHGHTFYDTYFDTSYAIPTPIQTGYVFDGWYTQKTPNINLSRFTDLVNVYRDMVLYAHWINE